MLEVEKIRHDQMWPDSVLVDEIVRYTYANITPRWWRRECCIERTLRRQTVAENTLVLSVSILSHLGLPFLKCYMTKLLLNIHQRRKSSCVHVDIDMLIGTCLKIIAQEKRMSKYC